MPELQVYSYYIGTIQSTSQYHHTASTGNGIGSYKIVKYTMLLTYLYDVWHVYNVNCWLLHIANIIALMITTLIQLNLFRTLAPCDGHTRHGGHISAPCGGWLIMPYRHHNATVMTPPVYYTQWHDHVLIKIQPIVYRKNHKPVSVYSNNYMTLW